MQANAEKEVQAEEQRIVEATKEETRKIVETAEQEIASAVKIARRDLKAYAADLAVTIAGKQIKVDAATDKSLVERFAQQLTGNGGRKDS
jgi:F0F1-type ATP synthase membrane subunit b/b'